jgi:DNA-binding transcriptional ArsR family regulator
VDETALIEGQSDDDVSTDEVFEVLSNRRRRFALHYLQHADKAVEIGELSERVASWENDIALEEVDSAARKRVYTSLQSHHLPKMDEQGIVSYDERAGVVELDEEGADLNVYLDVVTGKDVPWSQYYLGLAAVGAAVIAATAAGVWPMALLPDIAWAAFIVTTVFVSAMVHVYQDARNRLGASERPPELDER